MTDIIPRKQLGLVAPNKNDKNCVYIGRLPSPFSNEKTNYIAAEDFFVKDGYLINRMDSLKNGISDGMPEQFEMPLPGVKWMIDFIEQRFEQPPSMGGIAKETLHADTIVNNEELRLEYGVSVGGEGIGGYTITNFDRSSYILPRYSQEFSMTVEIWQKFGREFFKALQNRIEAGEFE